MSQYATLATLNPGEEARVAGLTTQGAMRRRLLDLGLTAGSQVRCLFRGAFGGPTAYLIRGAVIALRRADAATVQILP